MKVLKHKGNGRLFIATPALLKNENLKPASDAETKSFLSQFKKTDLKKIDESKKMIVKEKIIPKDFNWDVDVSFMGEPDVRMVAARMGVDIPAYMGIREMKDLVNEMLVELRPDDHQATKMRGQQSPDSNLQNLE